MGILFICSFGGHLCVHVSTPWHWSQNGAWHRLGVGSSRTAAPWHQTLRRHTHSSLVETGGRTREEKQHSIPVDSTMFGTVSQLKLLAATPVHRRVRPPTVTKVYEKEQQYAKNFNLLQIS